MSFLEVPSFDLLACQYLPYSGYGDYNIYNNTDLPIQYLQTIDQATQRLSDVFGIHNIHDASVIALMDEAISQMWEEGWNPHKSDINLFTTDFGCIVTQALREQLHAKLVLRSQSDLTHASVWWTDKGIEAFPFHATYKRLISRNEDSLTFFVQRIHSLLTSP